MLTAHFIKQEEDNFSVRLKEYSRDDEIDRAVEEIEIKIMVIQNLTATQPGIIINRRCISRCNGPNTPEMCVDKHVTLKSTEWLNHIFS